MRAGETSKEVDQITVDGKVLLYGRSADYQSCEDRGKHPATVAYQFKDDGSFEKLADLNTLFYENEAFPYALSPTSLVSAESACEGDGKDFVVDLTVKEGTITYTNKRASDAERRFGYYSYQDRIEQLEKEIGIASKIRYMHALPDSTVVSLWESPRKTFLAQTKGAHQNTSTQVNLSNAGGTVSYLTCADSQYVINTSGKSNEFSAPFLYSISKLENGEQKTIYTTTNKSLYEGVDAELPLANSEGLCVDGSILLLGTSRLATFNLSTNKLSLQELGGTTSMGLSIVNGTRDGFNYVDTKNRQLVCIGKDVGQKKTTAITSDILASPANANIRLLAFDDNSAVIARRQRLREPHHHTQGIRRIGHQGHKNCRQDGF